jgi:hypothetical protein
MRNIKLHFLENMLRVIKLRRFIRSEHLAGVSEVEVTHRFPSEKLDEEEIVWQL